MKRPYCVGLTGGIGSGKTSATDRFSELGVPVIDADTISHEVVQAGQPALQAIAECFGAEVINADGHLRREYLRKLIFDDPSARLKLEAIIHPQVFNEISRRLSLVKFPYCIVCSPLLLKSKSAYDLDRILVIDASEKLQIERASRRDNSEECEIKKIIDSQSNRQDRLASADDIIINDKDLSFLHEQIGKLHEKYLNIAKKGVAQCS
ncbi:MAG: dephospho-CoA kinase [Gammaproteobacteria bacterium]|jgi:dephospho-CoA kinase|nr:dephospho-CoA kinase [Gammaproteobacteria bacterium]